MCDLVWFILNQVDGILRYDCKNVCFIEILHNTKSTNTRHHVVSALHYDYFIMIIREMATA